MAEDSDDDATAVVNGGGVVWADPDAGEMPAETGALPWVKRLVRAPRLCEHNCLRPAELHHFKVLRQDVYDAIVADLFGDEPPSIDTPLNAHNGFCRQCAAADAGERANATAEYDRRRALLARLQASAASVPQMARASSRSSSSRSSRRWTCRRRHLAC